MNDFLQSVAAVLSSIKSIGKQVHTLYCPAIVRPPLKLLNFVVVVTHICIAPWAIHSCTVFEEFVAATDLGSYGTRALFRAFCAFLQQPSFTMGSSLTDCFLIFKHKISRTIKSSVIYAGIHDAYMIMFRLICSAFRSVAMIWNVSSVLANKLPCKLEFAIFYLFGWMYAWNEFLIPEIKRTAKFYGKTGTMEPHQPETWRRSPLM